MFYPHKPPDDISRAECAAVFDGFVPSDPMGGILVPATHPLHRGRTGRIESSFSPEQLGVIATAMSRANALAIGKTFGAGSAASVPLEQDIRTYYTAGMGFEAAVIACMCTLWRNFSRCYPELMPALEAMFATGGPIGGSAAIVEYLQPGLTAAQKRELQQDNLKLHLPEAFGRDIYLSPVHKVQRRRYHVACPAESLGKTLIRIAARCAIDLIGPTWKSEYIAADIERHRRDIALCLGELIAASNADVAPPPPLER